jgi:hypothetical protein
MNWIIHYYVGLDRCARVGRRAYRGVQGLRGIRRHHRPRQRLGRGHQSAAEASKKPKASIGSARAFVLCGMSIRG